MSKKARKILFVILVIFILVIATIFSINYIKNTQVTSSVRNNSSAFDTITGSDSKISSGLAPQLTGIVAPNEVAYDKQDPTKIIKKSNITMQTDNYDSSLKSINELIDNSGAMVVKMQETLGNTYDTMKAQNSNSRNVEIIIKVSKDKFEIFNNSLKGYANVISYYEEAQDISSSYADIESKISSYKLQEIQLNELLKKATAAKDLLEISNQTQNVIQQREYLQRQKNSYDNQIEYSTVTAKLIEVESIEIKEKGTFSRIEDTFKSSLSQMKEIFINIIMFIVYILPYIVVLAIFIIFVYSINKLKKK